MANYVAIELVDEGMTVLNMDLIMKVRLSTGDITLSDGSVVRVAASDLQSVLNQLKARTVYADGTPANFIDLPLR